MRKFHVNVILSLVPRSAICPLVIGQLSLPRSLRLPDRAAVDRLAIGLSGLCAVHCIASAVLVALASTAGGLLLSPVIHEVGLCIAIALGAVALVAGAARHGFLQPAAMGGLGLGIMAGALTLPHDGNAETFWTLIGVALLALGHDLNRRAGA
ncbi:MAG: MerC domain-containing protein [Sphingomonas sp.]|nr:MerC domain-containing protein [Sphingomonas sp.]